MSIQESDVSANMAGKIDLAFGLNGVASIDIPGAATQPVAVISGPDDKLYVCGTATFQNESKFFITALSANGQIVLEFGNNGYAIGVFEEAEASYAHALVLKDNRLLLVGASYIGTDPYPAMAQFDLMGNIDTTFGENGQGKIVHFIPGPAITSSRPELSSSLKPDSENPGIQQQSSMELDDGKTLLTHFFFRPGWPTYGVIVRTLVNGMLDTGFNATGYLDVIAPGYENGQTQIGSVTVDTEGRYVVCGGVWAIGSSLVKTFFARFSSEGAADPTFGPGGFRVINDPGGLPGGTRAEAIASLENGGILSLGGSVHDPYVGQLLQLTANGELDPDFNAGKPLSTRLAESSTLWKTFTRQTDGKLVVAGALDKQKNSLEFDIVIARFDQRGTLDVTFNEPLGWARTRLSPRTDGAFSVVLQRDKIVAAGISANKGVVVRYHG
ncbi:NHL repeat-containing protein [Pseudomonas sp. LB3P31]